MHKCTMILCCLIDFVFAHNEGDEDADGLADFAVAPAPERGCLNAELFGQCFIGETVRLSRTIEGCVNDLDYFNVVHECLTCLLLLCNDNAQKHESQGRNAILQSCNF
jgi:hypothetical protein